MALIADLLGTYWFIKPSQLSFASVHKSRGPPLRSTCIVCNPRLHLARHLFQANLDIMDDAKLLTEVLATVKVQTVQLKRCLEQDQIMEALKATSSMLAELRTSSLSPKQYYELYMSVFDSLRHLSNYLYEAHTEGKHHLADLYELVQ